MRHALASLLLLLLSGCAAGPGTPERAPAELRLAGTDTDGQARDYDAALARGESVALVFWQTWCESCRDEAPLVAAAARAERGRIHFVGVVPGAAARVDPAEVARVRAAWGYAFPQLRDPELTISRALGVHGTPTIVVVGQDRLVRFSGHRAPEDWTSLRGVAFDPAAEASSGARPATPGAAGEACEGGVCPLPAGGKP
ncbi:MAG: TlpA family protein disulfide reductase [Planctomycetota bacterium]